VSKRTIFSIAAAGIALAAAGCAASVWVTSDLRALGLGIIPAGVMAASLVGYFEWQTNLRRRVLADSTGHPATLDDGLEPTTRGWDGFRALRDATTSTLGAAMIVLLMPFAILLVGIPIVLAIRALVEAVSWLWGS